MKPESISEQMMFNTVRLETASGTGTGFFYNFVVGEATYPAIITNKHVVNYKQDENVKFHLHLQDGDGESNSTLFEKFGMNAGLCAVAISYYLGVGNDALKAYELGKRSVEEYPNSVTYNSLGWVCLTPEINRKDIAVEFFEKAIELAENEELKKDIAGNYFIALLENEQINEAEKVMCDLIDKHPCSQNFSNYAELLKRQGKLEDALKWGKKHFLL